MARRRETKPSLSGFLAGVLCTAGVAYNSGCMEAAMLIAADEIAQSNRDAARTIAFSRKSTSSSNYNVNERPIATFEAVQYIEGGMLDGFEWGRFHIFGDGMEFVGQKGRVITIPDASIYEVDALSLDFKKRVRIATRRGEYDFKFSKRDSDQMASFIMQHSKN